MSRKFARIKSELKRCAAALAAVSISMVSQPSAYAKTCADGSCEPHKGLEEIERQLLNKEAAGVWRNIDWSPDIDEAMKRAQAEKKPILVVLEVGHMAKKNAEKT